MACMDYGAILKVDSKIVNLNQDLFMESSDTGYVLDKAIYNYNGEDHEININGNYYVYAGDENLLLVFYKTWFYVIRNGIVIRSFDTYKGDFAAETLILDDRTEIEVSHIDKELKCSYIEKWADSWEDYVREKWYGTTGKEKLSQLHKGAYWKKRWDKHIKKLARNPVSYKYYSNKFIAKWIHNEKQYECVFGYGIDPDIETYKSIIADNSYRYTETERSFLDEWLGLVQNK